MRSHDDSHGSVHERRSCGPGTPLSRPLGHGRRTADLPRCSCRDGTAVCSEHDVRVEHRQQRGEVTAARGGEEGVDDFSLAGEIGVGNRGRSPYPAARAAGELPCCARGAPHDGSDLLEGHGEHVVQHEREPPAGESVSSTTSSARPTESASSASCSGSIPSSRLTIGSGTRAARGSLRGFSCREVRERSMSRHTRATTVVSRPPRLSMLLVSERLSRSQASWTASSASESEPSIR